MPYSVAVVSSLLRPRQSARRHETGFKITYDVAVETIYSAVSSGAQGHRPVTSLQGLDMLSSQACCEVSDWDLCIVQGEYGQNYKDRIDISHGHVLYPCVQKNLEDSAPAAVACRDVAAHV